MCRHSEESTVALGPVEVANGHQFQLLVFRSIICSRNWPQSRVRRLLRTRGDFRPELVDFGFERDYETGRAVDRRDFLHCAFRIARAGV